MNQTSASSVLVYGASGSYKTTAMTHAVEYIAKKTHRKTRVISAETAGVDLYAPMIDAGLVDPFWLTSSTFPRSTLRKIVRGEWVTPTDSKGVPVAAEKATLKRILPLEKIPVALRSDWPGGYIFEGTASIAELILQTLTSQGRKINEDVVGLYQEEGESLGAPARSHYGAAQQDILFLLREAAKQLFDISGGQVQYVFFTGHEAKGVDEHTRQPIYGPATVGGATTNKIAKEVGTMLHFQEMVETVNVVEGGKPKQQVNRSVRAYFRSHPDPENNAVNWQAKPRIPAIAEADAALMKKFPGGYFDLTLSPRMGLCEYLEFQDTLREMATSQLAGLAALLRPANGAGVVGVK